MKTLHSAKSRTWRHYAPAHYVIRSESQWQRMWRRGHLPMRVDEQPPPPSPPPVAFEKEMIIAVFQGWCPNGGYGIRIEEVNETDEGIDVVVKRRRPGPHDITTQAITHPSHLVSVRRSDKPVGFRIVEITGSQ